MLEHVDIPVGKHHVKATLVTPKISNGSLLWLLGRGAARLDSMEDRRRQAELFKKTVLTFDYGGTGETGGDFGQTLIGQHIEEAKAALDWLAGREGKEHQTIAGASYGGYVAGALATQNKVDNLVLRAPALFPTEVLGTKWRELEGMMPELISNYRHDIEAMKHNPLLVDLAKFAGRILIIQHGKDDVMPATVLDAYRETLPKADYWLAPGAPHAISEAGDEVRDNYEHYLATWLNP